MKRGDKEKGFTLIELLVVISIIGLLSSVVLTSLNSAKVKARNAKRMSDLRQLQLAITLFYENTGAYPSTGGGWRGKPGVDLAACTTSGTSWYTGSADWIPGLVTGGYLPSLPTDPGNSTACNTQYIYISNGVDYKLMYHNIAADGGNAFWANSPLRDPRRDGGVNAATDPLVNPNIGWSAVDGTAPWAVAYYTSGYAAW